MFISLYLSFQLVHPVFPPRGLHPCLHDRAREMRGAGARVQEEGGQDDRPVL